MVTLLDHANATGNTMRQGIVRNIIETSPIVSFLPFVNVPNLRYEFSKEGDLPTTGFRGMSAQYTAGQGTFDRNSISLKPMGGEIAIDRKMAKSPTFDAVDFASRQLNMLSRSASMNFKKFLFNGSVAGNPLEFDGLKRIVSADLDAAQTITYVANGSTVASAGANVTVSKFEELINATIRTPDAFYCNRTVMAHLHALATTSAANNAWASQFKIETAEVGGIRYRFASYSGIPIYAVDNDASDTAILAFDETVGNTSVNSSIYAVCWGDGYTVCLQDEAPEILREQDGTSQRIILDWAVAVAVEHPRAVAKLTGIKAS